MKRASLSCEACILAGGQSARMGHDKAQLRLGRKTLLGHVRAAARQAGFKVRVIRKDLVAHRGPVSGVYTALQTTKADAVLFLACDMPFVTAQLLQRVAAELKHGDAVFVRTDKVGFPFAVRTSASGLVEQLLSQEHCSLQTLASLLHAREIALRGTAARLVRNLNTPEEYAQALEEPAASLHHRSSRIARKRGAFS